MNHVRRSGFLYMDLDDFEEYLADKPDNEKWELIGGRVVKMMVGARWTHHRLVQNINFLLTSHLRERRENCRTFTETFWLKQRFLRLAVFPDVMVQCGAPDRDATAIDDPVVLFEVVSPGSEGRDRRDKASLYRRLPSLQHYVLVERDAVSVDVITRHGERAWLDEETIEGLDAVLESACPRG
jgi:Uma2 family endonuclease